MEKGHEIVKKLAAEADVMIENFAPGVIERLGRYDAIKAVNPSIIYAQVKGFAEDGPCRDYLSFDMIGRAAGGVMSITGSEPDGRPLKPGTTLGDTGTGMLMAISILSALYQKLRPVQGQRLTVAMQEAMLQ